MYGVVPASSARGGCVTLPIVGVSESAGVGRVASSGSSSGEAFSILLESSFAVAMLVLFVLTLSCEARMNVAALHQIVVALSVLFCAVAELRSPPERCCASSDSLFVCFCF